MIRVLYFALAILAFIELYSVGVLLLAKKTGERDYKLCLIPFYAFRVVNRMVGEFKVLTIPVHKFQGMAAIFCAVSVGAMVYACWGDANLPALSVPALWQIMGVVMGICFLCLWNGLVASSRKLFRRFNVRREGLATLFSALVITIPFQYAYYANRNEPRDLKDMY